MSAHEIHRLLGVTYKTAWFMCHRIREAMKTDTATNGRLGGADKVVEADETYVGGKQGNRATRVVRKKEAVVALVEREGHVRRSEEHTSELQSLMRISYAVFCLQKQKTNPTLATTAVKR